MHDKITRFQEIRMLLALIEHADAKGSVDFKTSGIGQALGVIESNGNRIDSMLYHLDESEIIYYKKIGEDGFAPIIMCGVKSATHDYLRGLVESEERNSLNLDSRITEILTFNPTALSQQIKNTQDKLAEVEAHIASNEFLKPLQKPLSEIRHHFESVSVVSENYEDVYKNIIRPVQEEGKSGIRTTVIWAILSITVSTAISLIVSNWGKITSMFGGG